MSQDEKNIDDIEAFAATKKDNDNDARSLEKANSLLLDKMNKVLEYLLPGPNNVASKDGDESALQSLLILRRETGAISTQHL